jgi:hypothetical protein
MKAACFYSFGIGRNGETSKRQDFGGDARSDAAAFVNRIIPGSHKKRQREHDSTYRKSGDKLFPLLLFFKD